MPLSRLLQRHPIGTTKFAQHLVTKRQPVRENHTHRETYLSSPRTLFTLTKNPIYPHRETYLSSPRTQINPINHKPMPSSLIFPGRYSALSMLNRHLKGESYKNSKFFILLDENTYSNCLATLICKVPVLEEAEFMEVPVGETAKSIEVVSQLWSTLMESHADRNSVIVNLGGGCVSDLGGFVAASYQRGIHYINIPTTLIGMVDAAIGGKTAVNLDGVKNAVGFFYTPVVTCVEPEFLDTLPAEEMQNGLCEMLKTLLLANPERYEQLRQQVAANQVLLSQELIQECVSVKSAVVKTDPTDRGVRKILNLGHTFAHAFECFSVHHTDSKMFPSAIPHGKAVGLGLWCALYLSVKKLGLPENVLTQYQEALQLLAPIPTITLSDTEELLSYMQHDKKNANDMILCVLLQEVAAPVIDVEVDENEIRDTLLKLSAFGKKLAPQK